MYYDLHTPTAVYRFTLYTTDSYFNRIAGIYIFLVIQNPAGLRHAEALKPVAEVLKPVAEALEATVNQILYLCITNNLYYRLNNHHKMAAALEMGMTHIGILKKSSGRQRKIIEREILKSLNPPLNQTWLYPDNVLQIQNN